jgi:hypothetical protein
MRNNRHKKNHRICNLWEVVAARFYYIHSNKIANQRPPSGKIVMKNVKFSKTNNFGKCF